MALGIEVPRSSWWSFDYHLDWLHAALTAGPGYDLDGLLGERKLNEPRVVTGSQEDIDLIVAFDRTVILVEAKLSTSWANKRMASKAERLTLLPTVHAQLHFVLASSAAPSKLDCSGLPAWALKTEGTATRPHHIDLSTGSGGPKPLMVSRCDVEGKKDVGGTSWMVCKA